MFPSRQGVVIWLHSLKNVKLLRKFGNIHYVSKKLKYVVMYCDVENIEAVQTKIKNLHFVKKVEPSYRPFLKDTFENSRPDKAKEYDYKVGI